MQDLIHFFELLNKEFPPPGRVSHALRYADGGLLLALWVGAGNCERIYLNNVDLNLGAEGVIQAIVATRKHARD